VDSAASVRLLVERLGDELVVASLGTPAFLLHAAGDRPDNFYMWAAMGMASSVGLGLAIARPERRVVVLDGDGAALMNLGGLVTVGWRRPANLLWLVLENGVFLETGRQPVATSAGADLVAIGRGAGIERAAAASAPAQLARLLEAGLAEPGPTLIVARVRDDGLVRPAAPSGPVREPSWLKHRFMAAAAPSPSGRTSP
jgi:thiamine pyrophosphate-dependent acetolactate synthase large subunit-like protein